jgi:hypothetical protein
LKEEKTGRGSLTKHFIASVPCGFGGLNSSLLSKILNKEKEKLITIVKSCKIDRK